MGVCERLAIQVLEHLISPTNRRNTLRHGKPEHLAVGMARDRFGRKGFIPIQLTTNERRKHILRVGGTGSGKSVSLLGECLQDIMSGRPFTIIDCHDTIDKLLRVVARGVVTGEIPSSVLENLLLIRLCDDEWAVRINPNECRFPAHAHKSIGKLVRIIELTFNIVLGGQTRQLVQSILILLAERQIPLTEVIALLHDPAVLRCHANVLINARAKEFFLTQWLKWSPRKRAQVAEAFINKISALLADPRIAAMLSSAVSDVDFRSAMDRGKTMIIEISKGEFFDSVSFLVSIFLVLLQQATFSRGDLPEEERTPHEIKIEEFPSFAADVTIEPFLNEGRKFGVGLGLVCQTLTSLSTELLSSVRANCYTQLYFRLSPEDAKKVVSGLEGDERDLVYHQLVSLPVGEAIFLQGGRNPLTLFVENVHVPTSLSEQELSVIRRIREKVGVPMNVALNRESNSMSEGASGVEEKSESIRARPMLGERDMDLIDGDE